MAFTLPLRVANDGALPWSEPPPDHDPVGRSDHPCNADHHRPLAVARRPGGETGSVAVAAPDLAPGDEAIVPLSLTAPSEPGSYLLVIDLISPLHGSMAAAGCPVAEARVLILPVDPALRHRQAE